MSKEIYENEHFDCMCHHMEHAITVSFWDYGDGELPEILLHVALCQRPKLFSRIWLALRYIAGKRSVYGHFGEWTLDQEDADRFMSFLSKYKESFKKWKDRKTVEFEKSKQ